MNYSACTSSRRSSVVIRYTVDSGDSLTEIADTVNRYGENDGLLDSIISNHFSRGYAEIDSLTIRQTQTLRVNRRKPVRVLDTCRACGKA